MSISTDYLVALPTGPSSQIFSYLELQDITRCRQVNWGWRHTANDRALWEEFARPFAVPNIVPSLTLLQLQRFIRAVRISESEMLQSNVAIINKIADFAIRVALGQNGVFRCFIGTGGRGLQCIAVKIQGARQSIRSGRVDIREDHRVRSIGRGEIGVSPGDLHRNARFTPNPDYMILRRRQVLADGISESLTGYQTRRLIRPVLDDVSSQTSHFEAVVSFPLIELGFQTEMEDKIRNIMIRRLGFFHEEFEFEEGCCAIS